VCPGCRMFGGLNIPSKPLIYFAVLRSGLPADQ